MEKVENIKKYMAIANVNQRELADTAGIAQTTLSKMLNGKYPISHKYLLKIAKALDVSVGELEEEQTFSPNAVVEGYIEYCGEIKRIRTYRDFEKLAKRIEYETKELPKEVRKIRAENNRNKQIVKKSRANSSYLFNIDDFAVEQTHDATAVDCWAFKIAKETKDGIAMDFGNQCSGYPFMFHGQLFHTSESAYLCGQFSNDTEKHKQIQNQLLGEKNGYLAKDRIKYPNEDLIREDWDMLNAEWMLYVIWHKCKGNRDFAEKLKALPIDAVIIENSTTVYENTSVLWGCENKELEEARDKVEKYAKLEYYKMKSLEKKKDLPSLADFVQRARDEIQYIGTYKNGCNYMGKILKRCQIALLNETEPNIDYALFNEKKIYFLGELLEF